MTKLGRRSALALCLGALILLLLNHLQLAALSAGVAQRASLPTEESAGWGHPAGLDPTLLGEAIGRFQLDERSLSREYALAASVSRAYLVSLGLDLLLTLPIAALLVTTSFALAALVIELRRRARAWTSALLVDLPDLLPYILWFFPFLALAMAYYRGVDLPTFRHYWVYLSLLYLGFAVFFLSYLLRADLRALLALNKRGVIEAERLAGLGSARIYLRLLRYEMILPKLGQIAFVTAFLLLFEGAMVQMIPFDQPSQPDTAMTQGGIYQSEAAQMDGNPDLLRNALQRIAAHSARARAADLVVAALPGLLFAPSASSALSRWIAVTDTDLVADDRARMAEGLSPYDQIDTYFRALARYYQINNYVLVTALLALMFFLTDLRRLEEKVHE